MVIGYIKNSGNESKPNFSFMMITDKKDQITQKAYLIFISEVVFADQYIAINEILKKTTSRKPHHHTE